MSISDIRNWVKRGRIELVLFALSVLGLIWFEVSAGNLQILIYKVCQLSFVTLAVHISRQYLFPDIGLYRLMQGFDGADRMDPIIRAAAILGLFIFMTGVIHGFLSGI